jgi:hypothetical protein
MKHLKQLLLLVFLSGMIISCSHNPSRSVAAETCHKQEWVDSEAYFDTYELCKGY